MQNPSLLSSPIPYPAVNHMLSHLLAGIRSVLGDQLVGLYVEGSLANGGFDQDSDIDFIAVSEGDINAEQFSALQAMHDRLAALDSPYAVNLEGLYLSRQAVRRHDPASPPFPNLERGPGERLKWVAYGDVWVIHRWVLRERGIVLYGPPPRTLVDPVTPADLRRGMRPLVDEWLVPMLNDPAPLAARGYQSYTVLTLCRMLYTFATGAVASKEGAARWARETLGEPWPALIDRAWAGRSVPSTPAAPEDTAATLDFIRYTIARA